MDQAEMRTRETNTSVFQLPATPRAVPQLFMHERCSAKPSRRLRSVEVPIHLYSVHKVGLAFSFKRETGTVMKHTEGGETARYWDSLSSGMYIVFDRV